MGVKWLIRGKFPQLKSLFMRKGSMMQKIINLMRREQGICAWLIGPSESFHYAIPLFNDRQSGWEVQISLCNSWEYVLIV